ncbi:MAG: hypothetical protein CL607_22955 [Anaerolineaceae bacterium]|nr:hypothetical protein [Anaerolineaceae bacterium]
MKHKAIAIRVTLIVLMLAFLGQVVSAMDLDGFSITEWRCDSLTYASHNYMADRDNTGVGKEEHRIIITDSSGTVIHDHTARNIVGEARFAGTDVLPFNLGTAKGNRLVFIWTSSAGNGLPEVVIHRETAVVNCAPGAEHANQNGQSNRNNNGHGRNG